MFCGPHQNVNTDCLTLAQNGNCYHDDPINDQKKTTHLQLQLKQEKMRAMH